MTRKKLSGILTATPMASGVDAEGNEVAIPIGEEIVVGEVDLELGKDELVVTSQSTGNSLTIGFKQSYASNFDSAFSTSSPRPRRSRRSPSQN